jgi:hypothetical protein
MKLTEVAAAKINKTVNRITLERGSSSGQDKYINQPTKVLTIASAIPESGGCRNSPSTIKIAISAGTTKRGKE